MGAVLPQTDQEIDQSRAPVVIGKAGEFAHQALKLLPVRLLWPRHLPCPIDAGGLVRARPVFVTPEYRQRGQFRIGFRSSSKKRLRRYEDPLGRGQAGRVVIASERGADQRQAQLVDSGPVALDLSDYDGTTGELAPKPGGVQRYAVERMRKLAELSLGLAIGAGPGPAS